MTWPRPSFILIWTLDRRGIAPFMVALRRQYHKAHKCMCVCSTRVTCIRGCVIAGGREELR